MASRAELITQLKIPRYHYWQWSSKEVLLYFFYRQNMMQTEGSKNCHCIQNMNMLTMSRTIKNIITLYEYCNTTTGRCNNKWGLCVREQHLIVELKVIKPERNYLQIDSSDLVEPVYLCLLPFREISGDKGNLAMIYWLTSQQ